MAYEQRSKILFYGCKLDQDSASCTKDGSSSAHDIFLEPNDPKEHPNSCDQFIESFPMCISNEKCPYKVKYELKEIIEPVMRST